MRALYSPMSGDARQVCARVLELRELNRDQWLERAKIRDIMNNRNALAALVGQRAGQQNAASSERLPIANLMLRQNTVLATELGRMSDTKVDTPVTDDGQRARKRADKRARIVATHDEVANMQMLLPQIGRWLPGYGFAAGVVKLGYSKHNDPFPVVELRDPFNTFPGEWGVGQQPADLACIYQMQRSALVAKFPQHKSEILGNLGRGPGGSVILDGGVQGLGTGSWANQTGGGAEVYEYYDERGCWWVLPDRNLVLSYVPNVLSTPAFRLVKRFCFDELVGSLDHAIGVMANMARLAILATIATEDAVMAETNVFGDMRGDNYRRGRKAVNIFATGTRVEKGATRVPFETFQQMDRIERQLRLVSGHPASADGEGGGGWVTGKGMQELQGSHGLEVREYQTAIKHWKQEINALRLEFDELVCNQEKKMYGIRGRTPFSESYTPKDDIDGDYVTREVYGAMAGFDDATKIITGLQLNQAGAIDMETFRENIDGLENIDRIAERVRAERSEAVLMTTLEGMGGQGDPRAMAALLEFMPESDLKKSLAEIFAAPAEEEAAPPAPPAGQMPPDVQSVMSRMSTNGGAFATAQTMNRVA